jgi:putative PIN family toxin of toxin-antitoxin system
MWRERRLQLIVSDEIQAEYLAVLAEIGASRAHLRALALRLATRATVTRVRPPRPVALSRDPLDNMFVAAAATGKARFLVTNDNDLLQIPAARLRPFRFRIVTPGGFLEAVSGRRA